MARFGNTSGRFEVGEPVIGFGTGIARQSRQTGLDDRPGNHRSRPERSPDRCPRADGSNPKASAETTNVLPAPSRPIMDPPSPDDRPRSLILRYHGRDPLATFTQMTTQTATHPEQVSERLPVMKAFLRHPVCTNSLSWRQSVGLPTKVWLSKMPGAGTFSNDKTRSQERLIQRE